MKSLYEGILGDIDDQIKINDKNIEHVTSWLGLISYHDFNKGVDEFFCNKILKHLIANKYKRVKNYTPMLRNNPNKWWVAVRDSNYDPRVLIFRQYTDEEYKKDGGNNWPLFHNVDVNENEIWINWFVNDKTLKILTHNGKSDMFEIPEELYDDCEELYNKVYKVRKK